MFEAAQRELGALALIAEDLGVITPPVERLRLELGLPGMVVLQFGFGGGPRNPHRPENHVELLVVYTGTHDTGDGRRLVGLAQRRARAPPRARPRRAALVADRARAASRAPSLSIVPAQDVLGLGSEARMNRPGVTDGNWRWRLEEGALTDALAARLREATARSGRCPRPVRGRRGRAARAPGSAWRRS